ncbi:protein kish-A isoform X2 [Numida meleagris]|uniref:protein kish-A isoform X2 n=1 Tax=Numida meleagris TaxID=8996 RepID=UPI000B3DA0EE|nr:protein kish-A isoform X2 [Numida meleagris]
MTIGNILEMRQDCWWAPFHKQPARESQGKLCSLKGNQMQLHLPWELAAFRNVHPFCFQDNTNCQSCHMQPVFSQSPLTGSLVLLIESTGHSEACSCFSCSDICSTDKRSAADIPLLYLDIS